MNPLLSRLQPYPFERLRQLFADVTPNPAYRPISLGIGEPKHPTPDFIKQALAGALDGLAAYPATAGEPRLREAFAGWLQRRYGLAVDAATQVLPVNGSREALFAFAQTVIDPGRDPLVVCPNPFYQIYEGAALLAGAQPYYAPSDPGRNFAVDWDSVPAEIWARTQLLYVCSPGNPTGAVMPLDEWQQAVRAVRPPRLRHRLRRVLQRDLLPGRAAAGRAGSRRPPGPRRLPQPGVLHQPVQAQQRARHAQRLRGRRRGPAQAVPAVSHLPRQRDEPGGAAGQHRRLERRAARDREPRAVPATSSRRSRPCSPGAGRAAARRGFLSLGRRARAATPSSPATCWLNTMSPCCPAATSPADSGGDRTPAPAASAWPWWPQTAECVEAAQRIVQFVQSRPK